MSEDEDPQEWIVVKSKRSKKCKKEYNPSKIQSKGQSTPLSQYPEDVAQEFVSSDLFKSNLDLINSILPKSECLYINCLGLGNFNSSLKPFLQYIFLKQGIIKELSKQNRLIKVNIYDPIFNEFEIKQIKENSWQCKPIEQELLHYHCLWYMPHCQRQLYEWVFNKKASKQCQWTFVGNSIKQYSQRCLSLGQPVPSIFQNRQIKENKLKDYKQAFNDTYAYRL